MGRLRQGQGWESGWGLQPSPGTHLGQRDLHVHPDTSQPCHPLCATSVSQCPLPTITPVSPPPKIQVLLSP